MGAYSAAVRPPCRGCCGCHHAGHGRVPLHCQGRRGEHTQLVGQLLGAATRDARLHGSNQRTGVHMDPCTNHHHCLPPGVTEYASLYSIQPPTHPPPNLLQVALAPVTVELWSLPSWSCSTPPCRNDAHLNGSLGTPLHTLRVHSVTADSLGGSGGEAQLPPWALTLTPTLILI